MGWFWGLLRRPRGRHALGAAVTSIPSAPLRLVAPAAAVPAAAVPAAAVPAAAAPAAAAPVRGPAPAVATLPSVPVSRVQLGFRDGSTASLAADSEQAVAFEALAGLLNRRSS